MTITNTCTYGVRTVLPPVTKESFSFNMMDFSPCMVFTMRTSWVTAPLDMGGMELLEGGNISNFIYLGTAAYGLSVLQKK